MKGSYNVMIIARLPISWFDLFQLMLQMQKKLVSRESLPKWVKCWRVE